MPALLLKILETIALKLLAPELAIKLLVALLEALAARSDNKLDDKAVALIKEQLEK